MGLHFIVSLLLVRLAAFPVLRLFLSVQPQGVA